MRSTRTLDELLESLRGGACAHDVPASVRDAAEAATRRAFCALGDDAHHLDGALEFRVRRYFAAVVRRRLVRGGEGRRAASRLVLATVVDDLRKSGRSGDAIAEHLTRHWGGSVPADLLDEVKLQLSA